MGRRTLTVRDAEQATRAVEITLIVEQEDPTEKGEEYRHEYLTTVIIETAQRVTRSATASDGSNGGGQLAQCRG